MLLLLEGGIRFEDPKTEDTAAVMELAKKDEVCCWGAAGAVEAPLK